MASWVVLLFSGFAGFFLLALLPMCIELGVEVTYPATEGVVTGIYLFYLSIISYLLIYLFFFCFVKKRCFIVTWKSLRSYFFCCFGNFDRT